MQGRIVAYIHKQKGRSGVEVDWVCAFEEKSGRHALRIDKYADTIGEDRPVGYSVHW